MPPSMICGATGSCTSTLAALARPLAVDMAVHEELRRHDVELLAHVFAHAHHGSAAPGRRAGCVLGLVMVLHTAQMLGQRLPLGLAPLLGLCLGLRGQLGLQLLQLRLQARLVLGQRLLEHAALLGVHGFGLGAELPSLQPRQLEGDLLELGVLELDGLLVLLDLPGLRGNVLQHAGRHFGHCARAQSLEVLGLERLHIEHARIVRMRTGCAIGASSDCRTRPASITRA